MRHLCQAVLAVGLLLATSSACGAPPEPIATVRAIEGDVRIVRGGKSIKATPHLYLYEGDLVETGGRGKVALDMTDDTAISMGRKSRILLTKFQFHPKEKNLSFLVRVLKGTASFILGEIGRLAPNRIRIETPQAVIGVRGSHVLVKVD